MARTESVAERIRELGVKNKTTRKTKWGLSKLKELFFLLFLHVFTFLLPLRFAPVKSKLSYWFYFSFSFYAFLDIGFVPEIHLFTKAYRGGFFQASVEMIV